MISDGRLARVRDWLTLGLGRMARRLGLPGVMASVEITDEVTGQRIAVTVGLLFTRLRVNGRDYYFRRFSGRFDGTGMGCG